LHCVLACDVPCRIHFLNEHFIQNKWSSR
jgi:hypothetical protein